MMNRRMIGVLGACGFLWLASGGCGPGGQVQRQDRAGGTKVVTRKDKAWFANAKVGLFTHYTYGTYRNGAKGFGGTWQSRTNSAIGKDVEDVASHFDAEAFAAAAEDMGAQYVVFTVCHAGFNLLFPSETMRETGLVQKTSKTDVIARLLAALERRDIPLVLYMPPNDDHDIDGADLKKMYAVGGREGFINRLLAEISVRYKGRIAGYWFDQGGPAPSAKATLLKGNPDAVVFVNNGVTRAESRTGISDFLVSEYFDRMTDAAADSEPTHHSQINRVIGGTWWACGGKASVSARGMFRWTVRVAATAGQQNAGVNWACGPYIDQTWEEGTRELMHQFGEEVRARAASLYGTVPGKSYVTRPRSRLKPSDWGVSTESPDGSVVYLHVLNPPPNGTLCLPPAADGKTFRQASMLDGSAAGLRKTDQGYEITCPGKWDRTDTVIVLTAQKQ